MRIFDISQEVFSCAVFPGDPAPERIEMMKIKDGAVCNLTAFKMCAHNGTHVDAPYHFYDDGKRLDEVALERFVGYAYVTEHDGDISAEDARKIMQKAKDAEYGQIGQTEPNAWKNAGIDDVSKEKILSCEKRNHSGASKRILVKGKAVMTEGAAKVFAEEKIFLYGNESQTVGPEDAPMKVHLIMLGAEIVLLEGIRLAEVDEGVYFLNAAPINLGGADGAPCRAILVKD